MDLTPGPERPRVFEPRIWSHITDVLPDGHPLAWESQYCARCGAMVHAFNNECMTTWVETGNGPYCVVCFVKAIETAEDGNVYHLLDEGGWALAVDHDREEAYRAGREDAARAVSDKLIEWADDEARRPRRTCCSHAIEEWIRQAAALARKEINLGRSSGSEEPGSSSGTEAGGGDA